METRLLFPLVMLLGILLESNLVFPTPVSESDHSVLEQASVFETGKFHPITSDVGTASSCSPPKPLLIVRPEEQGTYPVILFHHGTACQNSWYTDVFSFISSHGYIVVAPQLYDLIPPSGQGELDLAAKVANWLPSGLRCVLPENIEGDLQNLALAGHSRGGYIAFALALGLADVSFEVNFSALIGVDPVAGTSKNDQLEPKMLDHESCSFNISIPVAIIGTGLGNKPVLPLMPTCAPDGVSHTEIFNGCRPPCSHFVTTDYGHMDVLDDDIGVVGGLARAACKGSGSGVSRDPMRKTAGGIFVAFLEAFFNGNYTEYNNILQKPNYFAPATLDPVQNKSEGTSCSGLSAMSMPAFSF
ncbi:CHLOROPHYLLASE-1 [Salix purpurea]|uniref:CHLOROPHYLLASE-1 n=1 Tax=Salix purpurea TaxID=77065 RepID=A0A9Q1AJQ0_SALPP|nr:CHLOROPHYLLASE-1 [Salix purpurea]